MGDINDIIQGAIETIGDNVHDQLGITVEEGDRAVAIELLVGLSRFEEEADDANKEASKRAGGGGVIESRIEDIDQGRGEDGLEVAVKFIWEAINARGGAPADR